jgi:hypothetical protein
VEADRSRRLLAVASLGIGFVVLTLLALRPPTELAFPACPLHWVTGLHCPGCGSLRAVHFLLQGEWQTAMQYNLLAVVLFPLVSVLLLAEFLNAFGRRLLARVQLPSTAVWILLVVILLFGVTRNLPLHPFNQFAPAAAAEIDSSLP